MTIYNLCALMFLSVLTTQLFATDSSGKESARLQIDKVTIAVDDLQKMKEFYSKTLGVPFNDIQAGSDTLSVGKLETIEILLCPKSLAGIAAIENTIQIRFIVEDVKSAFTNALANGGKNIAEPREGPDHRMSASVRDPDGNSLEFIEPRK